MIKRIDHVAIAVKNLDQAVCTFENLFGLRPSRIEDIPDQGVRAFTTSAWKLMTPMRSSSGLMPEVQDLLISKVERDWRERSVSSIPNLSTVSLPS